VRVVQALSILLIGGVAIILVLVFLGFAHVLTSSLRDHGTVAGDGKVLDTGSPDPAAPHKPASLFTGCCQRNVKFMKLALGLTSSLQVTVVDRFPSYRPRYLCGLRHIELLHVNKLLTATFLVAVAVLFSRDYVPKWIGGWWCAGRWAVGGGRWVVGGGGWRVGRGAWAGRVVTACEAWRC
jgi:hypothetical protein